MMIVTEKGSGIARRRGNWASRIRSSIPFPPLTSFCRYTKLESVS